MNPYEQFLLIMVAADEMNKKEQQNNKTQRPSRSLTAIRDIALLDALLTGAPYTIQDGSMTVLVNGTEYRLSVEYFKQMARKKGKEEAAEMELDEPKDIRPVMSYNDQETGNDLMRKLLVLESMCALREKKMYMPDFPQEAFRFQDEDMLSVMETVKQENELLRAKVSELEKELAQAANEISDLLAKEKQLNVALASQKRITMSLSFYYTYLLQNPGVVPNNGNRPEGGRIDKAADDEAVEGPGNPRSSLAESGSAGPEPANIAEPPAAQEVHEDYGTFVRPVRLEKDSAPAVSEEPPVRQEPDDIDIRPTSTPEPAVAEPPVQPVMDGEPAVRDILPGSDPIPQPGMHEDGILRVALLPVMPKKAMLMSKINGIVTDEDGNSNRFFAFVAPVDADGRTFIWVSMGDRTYTSVSSSYQTYASVVADDVTFEAKWRDNQDPLLRLANVSKEDGYQMKKKTESRMGIGHVYISRDGLGVHCFPVDGTNAEDGLANIMYLIDTGRSTRTGDNSLRRRIEFDHHKERYEVECRWNDNNELTAYFLN